MWCETYRSCDRVVEKSFEAQSEGRRSIREQHSTIAPPDRVDDVIKPRVRQDCSTRLRTLCSSQRFLTQCKFFRLDRAINTKGPCMLLIFHT